MWPISALDLGGLPILRFGSVQGGSQPLIQLRAYPGAFCLCAQAAGPLIRARTHPEFQLWAPSPLIWVRASRASGELRGCFSAFTFQGLTREGRQRPRLLRLLQRVL